MSRVPIKLRVQRERWELQVLVITEGKGDVDTGRGFCTPASPSVPNLNLLPVVQSLSPSLTCTLNMKEYKSEGVHDNGGIFYS